MIPKKIHYCWFGNKSKPSDVMKCIESWKQKCPDYEIIEWNESNYDVTKNSFLKSAYESKQWAFVSDYARLDIVNEYGGIYLDTDVELLKNLDFLLKYDCYFGIQQSDLSIATGLGFGAISHHRAISEMLKQYDSISFDINNLQLIACPILNTKAMEMFGYKKENISQIVCDAIVFPCLYFDPLAPGTDKSLVCSRTVSIHHYSASWTSVENRLKRKIYRKIGLENIIKIKVFLKKIFLYK